MHKTSDLIRFLHKVYKKEGALSCIGTLGVWGVTFPYIVAQKVKHRRVSGRTLKRIQGSLMELDLDDQGLSYDLYCKGFREPYLTDWWQNNITSKDVVYDIGANIGYYALQAARNGAKVLAIEPMPESYERLAGNALVNGYENILPVNVAAGDQDGRLTIHWETHWNYAAIVPSTWIKQPRNSRDVLCYRLDTIYETVGVLPTVIRMDVEGYEVEIIRGAQGIIQKCENLIIAMELHTGKLAEINPEGIREMLLTLDGHGFTVDCCFKEPHPLVSGNKLGVKALNFLHGLKGNRIGYNKYTMEDLITSDHFKQLDSGLQVIFKKYKPTDPEEDPAWVQIKADKESKDKTRGY